MVEKRLRRYIFPSVLAMIGISCYILADTFFISLAEGSNGITALNLTLPIYAVMFAIGSMLGIGSATKYSIDRALGKTDHESCFSNSIFWALIISIFFVLTGLLAPGYVLRLMGADDVIMKTGLPYLRIVMMFTPAFMLNYTMTAFVRNDNAPNIAMAATLSSSFFNILFDYILMFPIGMGMRGAALATGISPIVSICVTLIHYLSEKNTVKFVMKPPSVRKLFQSCSLGVSGFVGEISSGVTTFSFNFVLLRSIGNIGVAAYGVIANISIVGIAVFNGISQGLQPMASEAADKKDVHKRIYRHSLLIGLVISGILILICQVFSVNIVDMFNSEGSAKLSEYAVIGLRIYCVGFLLAVVNIISSGYFGAIGKATECSVISLLRGVFAIVLFVVVLPEFFGVYGVWLAFPVAELFTFIVSMFFMKKDSGRALKKVPK